MFIHFSVGDNSISCLNITYHMSISGFASFLIQIEQSSIGFKVGVKRCYFEDELSLHCFLVLGLAIIGLAFFFSSAFLASSIFLYGCIQLHCTNGHYMVPVWHQC